MYLFALFPFFSISFTAVYCAAAAAAVMLWTEVGAVSMKYDRHDFWAANAAPENWMRKWKTDRQKKRRHYPSNSSDDGRECLYHIYIYISFLQGEWLPWLLLPLLSIMLNEIGVRRCNKNWWCIILLCICSDTLLSDCITCPWKCFSVVCNMTVCILFRNRYIPSILDYLVFVLLSDGGGHRSVPTASDEGWMCMRGCVCKSLQGIVTNPCHLYRVQSVN